MIWATWIFDRYERVKESLTYTLHILFTQACDASNGDYFLSNGKQNFVFKNLFRAVPDPDLEIMGTWTPKNFLFRNFGPQCGLKIRGGGPGPPWIHHYRGSDLFLER